MRVPPQISGRGCLQTSLEEDCLEGQLPPGPALFLLDLAHAACLVGSPRERLSLFPLGPLAVPFPRTDNGLVPSFGPNCLEAYSLVAKGPEACPQSVTHGGGGGGGVSCWLGLWWPWALLLCSCLGQLTPGTSSVVLRKNLAAVLSLHPLPSPPLRPPPHPPNTYSTTTTKPRSQMSESLFGLKPLAKKQLTMFFL